jgi:PAS domain S-box-containing protein
MFAYAAAELIGKSTTLLYGTARIPPGLGEAGWPVVARGEILRTELQLSRKDGSRGWYDISISWLSPDSDEQCGAFIDVSADRSTWFSLLEAEEHYRGIFAAMAEGLVVHAGDGRVIDANAAAERILKLSRDQILGKISRDPDWGAVHEDGSPFPGEEHPASVALRTGQPLRNQLMGVRANGELCWISVNAQPIFADGSSVPSAVIATFVDVTEAHIASEAIAKSLGAKDVMLREIHHRVKNNMQVISSLLRMQSRNLHDAESGSVLLECDERIRSMALVHEQLYGTTSLTAIDFGKYLGDLSRLIAQSHNTRQTCVKITRDCDSLTVDVGNAVPLGLIANELMTNVFKHAFNERPEGELKLGLKRTGVQTLLLSVVDDGVGLPANFDIGATKSVGLSIVRNLVRQLRASVSFRAVEGGGTGIELSTDTGG